MSMLFRFTENLEPERLPELFSCGCVCGTFVTFLMHHLLCSKENRRCKPKNVFNIWIWVVFYFTIAAFLINRPHLMQLRYLSKYFFTVGPTPSCCTPGMLFVAEKASHWVNYMKTHTCGVNYGKDTMREFIIKITESWTITNSIIFLLQKNFNLTNPWFLKTFVNLKPKLTSLFLSLKQC